MRHWAWVVVAIGAMTATPATAQTKLAYAFQPGATHRQQLIQSTRIDVIPPGQKDTYTTNIDQSCQLITTVKNLREDGTAELAQHFSQISMTLQLPPPSGKRFTADTAKPQPSDDKTENDIRESFRKVVGLDWLLTLKPDGAVSKVGLSDELTDVLVDNPQVGPLTDTFSDSGLRKLWEQSTLLFPSRPLKKGDQWEQTVTTNLPTGKLTTKRRCTYAGTVEDGMEKITVELEAAFEPAKSSTRVWELTSNSGDGEVYLNPRSGHIARSRFTQQLVLKEGPPERQGIQKINTVVTLLPADERAEKKK